MKIKQKLTEFCIELECEGIYVYSSTIVSFPGLLAGIFSFVASKNSEKLGDEAITLHCQINVIK